MLGCVAGRHKEHADSRYRAFGEGLFSVAQVLGDHSQRNNKPNRSPDIAMVFEVNGLHFFCQVKTLGTRIKNNYPVKLKIV